jgi:hypothetical protein
MKLIVLKNISLNINYREMEVSLYIKKLTPPQATQNMPHGFKGFKFKNYII